MDLNLFENLKKHIESNDVINNFIEELGSFLKNANSQENNESYSNNFHTKENNNTNFLSNSKNQNLAQNRKEGHLYLVTEDRNNEIYLWDFTDKSKTEFKETGLSDDLLNIAKEGAMLQYKNGRYELYSPYGYDMLFKENNNIKDEK